MEDDRDTKEEGVLRCDPEAQCHPKIEYMKQFKYCSAEQRRLAFIVYMDLCEAKDFWNVGIHGCESIGAILISGHPMKHDPKILILPVDRNDELSIEKLRDYVCKVKVDGLDVNSLTLAICETDSTIVYYEVTDGLVVPESPSEIEGKRQRRTWKMQKRREALKDNVVYQSK
ncbi:unnamed protein product [Owenia fusiformis]|uniref:Uncharacterized protein n=1 Tax=Owenia fusiformis TaxID=6347 RepID=A0A8J1XNN3_OWEFU|nr:unnamed protein product [Owenia fusiformis]